MEDDSVEPPRELGLYLEALRRRDVLELDRSEGGSDVTHHLDDDVGVSAVDEDRDGADVHHATEDDPFALHDGHPRNRPDVAQTQHGRPVGDYRHGVPDVRVGVGLRRVIGDGLAHLSHARGVHGQEVRDGLQGHATHDLELAPQVHLQHMV